MIKNNALGAFVIILIGAIIGLTFTGQIADSVFEETNLIALVNDSVDISTARTGIDNQTTDTVLFTVANNPTEGISGFVLRADNSSVAVNGTDYISNETFGTYTLSNTPFWEGNPSNTTFVDYNYRGANFVADPTTQVLLNTLLIFLSISVVIFVIGVFLKMKDTQYLMRR